MQQFMIQKNMAMEFFESISRYTHKKAIEEQVRDFEYTLDTVIVQWTEEIDAKISPFLKTDLELIRGMRKLHKLFYTLIYSHKLHTPVEFLDFLKNMQGTDFLWNYLQVFGLEWDKTSPFAGEKLKEVLQEYEDNQDSINFILETIRHPDELKDRIHQAFRSFYEKFFQPIESQVSQYIDEKIVEHTKLYAENPELFIKTMFLLDFNELQKISEVCNIQVYASQFGELSVGVELISDVERLVVYGISMEQRYQREKMAHIQRLFFKLLADEKRVEILKLLAEREWYGNELAKHFGLTTATMSYHLSRLLDLGLVSIIEGEQNRFYYKLEKKRLKELFMGALRELVGEEV